MDDTSVILINKKRRRHNLDEDLTSVLSIMKEVKENDILIGLVNYLMILLFLFCHS